MKQKLVVAVVVIVAVLAIGPFLTMPAAQAAPGENSIRVLLLYDPQADTSSVSTIPAYESVLQEEGVPYVATDIRSLAGAVTAEFVKKVPAVILPDGALQTLPDGFVDWLQKYLDKGGNVAVIYDPGVKDAGGNYLDRTPLADIVGFNYITYGDNGVKAYEYGTFRFASEAARDTFQVPAGKTVDKLTVSSYTYGALQYPIARNERVRDIPESDIYASVVMKTKQQFPALVVTGYANGKVMYVNLPLGYLKGNSDDLPLRAMLRTFLFDIVTIPHVMNVANGMGGLVFNWHVDADIEHISLPYMMKHVFRKELALSFHVTAGPFFLKPNDDAGFDAAGLGKELVLMLKDYGTIGSHGGWAHNWFSDNINSGAFKEQEIYENIRRNNECLEKIIGYKVTEYAAPNGVHPQPMATRALERLGIIAYYYVGDTGSAPNRTFYEGKMVSDKCLAFPIVPFGVAGSIWEMKAVAKKSDSEVAQWFADALSYVKRNRTVRLLYSHPYDYQNYPGPIKDFLDNLVEAKTSNAITVLPMSDFARFTFRFLKTDYAFNFVDNKLVVSLNNPQSLAGITVAVPKKSYRRPLANLVIQEDDRYYYLTMAGGADDREKLITLSPR